MLFRTAGNLRSDCVRATATFFFLPVCVLQIVRTHTHTPFFSFSFGFAVLPPQVDQVSTGRVCIVPLPLSFSLLCIRTLSSKRVQTEKRRKESTMVYPKLYLQLFTFLAIITLLALSGKCFLSQTSVKTFFSAHELLERLQNAFICILRQTQTEA